MGPQARRAVTMPVGIKLNGADLAQGDNVVIDAMNLELAHRMRQISIMPRDLLVRYVVIDRPLESKQRDAGWRAEKGIVERYHGRFQECVAGALDADGLDGIEVIECG